MKIDERVIKRLGYLCRSYDGIVKLGTQTKNRLHAMLDDADPAHQDEIVMMEKIQAGLTRDIERECRYWPIYNEWLKNVKGVGPYICGNLILLYYYKFMPICVKCGGDLDKIEGGMKCAACGKESKGDGLLKHKVAYKDFPNISKWWKYMGRHAEEGKMPKRQKGKVVDWSPRGRLIGYNIGEQFNRQKEDHPYKAFALAEKKQLEGREGLTKLHIHRMALNKAVKLFLAHFWMVARELDGLPVTEPYAGTILGHTGIIQPFYWHEKMRKAA